MACNSCPSGARRWRRARPRRRTATTATRSCSVWPAGGEVHTEGSVQRFGADCTLVLPQGRDHQIFNVGPQPMEIVGLFGATPVLTRLPDGSALELPWRS